LTTLAIASQKGGVGKTTVALNLSFSLSRRRWKTLLVDTDPQGSVGQSIKNAVRAGKGLAAYLGGTELADAVIRTKLDGFDLLIAGESPMMLAAHATSSSGLAAGIRRVVEEAEQSYDVIVLDTPSGMYGITETVLRQAEFLLVPLQAEPLALRSTRQVIDVIGDLRRDGAPVSIVAFVITMLNSRNEVSLNVAQESWSMLPTDLVLDGFVPRDAAFLHASAYGVPLGLLSKRPPPVATVFDQIAIEMETRMGLLEEEEIEGPISLLD